MRWQNIMKEKQFIEMIFRIQKPLFMKAYCKFLNDNTIEAQNFYKHIISGQVSLQKWDHIYI